MTLRVSAHAKVQNYFLYMESRMKEERDDFDVKRFVERMRWRMKQQELGNEKESQFVRDMKEKRWRRLTENGTKHIQ